MSTPPRCVGTCKDGSQCGRRVIDGSHPPLCHLHRAKPNLSPIIPPPDAEVDEIKLLKQLTRSTDPRVKLRAVDLLITLRRKDEKGCERCAEAAEKDRVRADIVSRMTDAQIAEVCALKKQFFAIFEAAKTQPVDASERTPGANYV